MAHMMPWARTKKWIRGIPSPGWSNEGQCSRSFHLVFFRLQGFLHFSPRVAVSIWTPPVKYNFCRGPPVIPDLVFLHLLFYCFILLFVSNSSPILFDFCGVLCVLFGCIWVLGVQNIGRDSRADVAERFGAEQVGMCQQEGSPFGFLSSRRESRVGGNCGACGPHEHPSKFLSGCLWGPNAAIAQKD